MVSVVNAFIFNEPPKLAFPLGSAGVGKTSELPDGRTHLKTHSGQNNCTTKCIHQIHTRMVPIIPNHLRESNSSINPDGPAVNYDIAWVLLDFA